MMRSLWRANKSTNRRGHGNGAMIAVILISLVGALVFGQIDITVAPTKNGDDQNLVHCKIGVQYDGECGPYWKDDVNMFEVHLDAHYKNLKLAPNEFQHHIIWSQDGAFISTDVLIDARCNHVTPHMPFHSWADCLVLILPSLTSYWASVKPKFPKMKPNILILVDESSEKMCSTLPSNFQDQHPAVFDKSKLKDLSVYNRAITTSPQDREFLAVFRDLLSENFAVRCMKVSVFHWTHKLWYKVNTSPVVSKEYVFFPTLLLPPSELLAGVSPEEEDVEESEDVNESGGEDESPNAEDAVAKHYRDNVAALKNTFVRRHQKYCNPNTSSTGGRVGNGVGVVLFVTGEGSAMDIQQSKFNILNRWMNFAVDMVNNQIDAVFEVFQFTGDESMCDTVMLFSAARIIIGTANENMAHLIFAHPDVLVLELINDEAISSKTTVLANVLNLKLERINFQRPVPGWAERAPAGEKQRQKQAQTLTEDPEAHRASRYVAEVLSRHLSGEAAELMIEQHMIHCSPATWAKPACKRYWVAKDGKYNTPLRDHYQLLALLGSQPLDMRSHAHADPSRLRVTRSMKVADLVVDARCHHPNPADPFHAVADCQMFILPTLRAYAAAQLRRYAVGLVAKPKLVVVVDESTDRFCVDLPTDFAVTVIQSRGGGSASPASGNSSSAPKGKSNANSNANVNSYANGGQNSSAVSSAMLTTKEDADFNKLFRDLFSEYFSVSCVKLSVYPSSNHWYKTKDLTVVSKELLWINEQKYPFSSNLYDLASSVDMQGGEVNTSWVNEFRDIYWKRFRSYCEIWPSSIIQDVVSEVKAQGLGDHVRQRSVVIIDKSLTSALDFYKHPIYSHMKAILDDINSKFASEYQMLLYNGDESTCETVGVFLSAKLVVAVNDACILHAVLARGGTEVALINTWEPQVNSSAAMRAEKMLARNEKFAQSLRMATHMLHLPLSNSSVPKKPKILHQKHSKKSHTHRIHSASALSSNKSADAMTNSPVGALEGPKEDLSSFLVVGDGDPLAGGLQALAATFLQVLVYTAPAPAPTTAPQAPAHGKEDDDISASLRQYMLNAPTLRTTITPAPIPLAGESTEHLFVGTDVVMWLGVAVVMVLSSFAAGAYFAPRLQGIATMPS